MARELRDEAQREVARWRARQDAREDADEVAYRRRTLARYRDPAAAAEREDARRRVVPDPCVGRPPFLCGGPLRSILSGMNTATTIEGLDLAEVQPLRPEFGNFTWTSMFPVAPTATVIDGEARFEPPRAGMPPGAMGNFNITSLFTPPQPKERDPLLSPPAPRPTPPNLDDVARDAERRARDRRGVACAAASRSREALERVREIDREVAAPLTQAQQVDRVARRKAAAALALREGKTAALAHLMADNAKVEAVVARDGAAAAKRGDAQGASASRSALAIVRGKDAALRAVRGRQKVRWAWGTAKLKADASEKRAAADRRLIERLEAHRLALLAANVQLRATAPGLSQTQVRRNLDRIRQLDESIRKARARVAELEIRGAQARRVQGAIGAAHGASLSRSSVVATGGLGAIENFEDFGVGEEITDAALEAGKEALAPVVQRQIDRVAAAAGKAGGYGTAPTADAAAKLQKAREHLRRLRAGGGAAAPASGGGAKKALLIGGGVAAVGAAVYFLRR